MTGLPEEQGQSCAWVLAILCLIPPVTPLGIWMIYMLTKRANETK